MFVCKWSHAIQFDSMICYFKLKYVHTFICIANPSVHHNDLVSYILFMYSTLMIFFVGTFSFIMSRNHVLKNCLVPVKHVLPLFSYTRSILSFTSKVYLLLWILPYWLNYLSSHCLHLSRQRVNYFYHSLVMFCSQQWRHGSMRQ